MAIPQTMQHAETPYERLVKRVQEILSSPRSQIEHCAVISKRPEDSDQHWERLLEEMSDAEGVTLSCRTPDVVHVAWFVDTNTEDNTL